MQQVELAHWLEGGMTGDPEQLATDLEEQVERAFCRPDSIHATHRTGNIDNPELN
jgi:hypothetical protein